MARRWRAWYVVPKLRLQRHTHILYEQWPYSYDSCDVGTLANQTLNGLPIAATVNGDASQNGVLSFLPGQRLSRCTCDGEIHPGPKHTDGTYVGRSAPEIDVFEALVSDSGGQVSMSSQWAVRVVLPSQSWYPSLSNDGYSPSMKRTSGSTRLTTM